MLRTKIGWSKILDDCQTTIENKHGIEKSKLHLNGVSGHQDKDLLQLTFRCDGHNDNMSAYVYIKDMYIMVGE